MGKRHSKPSIQAWISRESPEGGCVIINDTSSQTRLLQEILKQKRTVTAYEGYLVNDEDNLDPVGKEVGKSKSDDDFPLEIVELPAEHDGKHIDIHFVKEGNLDEATQTPSFKPEDIDCGVSVRSMNSDRQQWSFSLYNFEDHGHISKEDLTNLVRSIYDALGKSVGKVKKSSRNPVKKVKVHITVSKDKHTKKTPGHSVVPRREVAVGAENEMGGTEKQLEQLQLREERHEAIRKSKKRKEKEEKHSIAQVLNNDLSKTPLHLAKCKSCRSAEDKPDNSRRSTGLSSKNSNLLADKPNFPTRKETRPGGCIDDTKMAILSQDIWRMAENKSNSRSQRRNSQRKAICSGHTSPGERISGHISCVTHIPADTTPVAVPVLMKDIPLEPSYAYHTEDNNYLYVHAAPRQPPFEERRSGRRRKSKQRKLRDISDDSDGMPRAFPGSTPVVHRHEHVHHHYHHYGEKPS